MKHNPFLKKTIYLLLSSVFLFTLNACGQNSTSTPETTDASPTPSSTVTANPAQPSESASPQTSDDESFANNEVSSANNDALAAYDNFLAGSINAQDLKHEISDGVVAMKDISMEPDLKTYYAFFDMNGDGIPELHLRPIVGGSYAIFTYLDGQIVLWHDGTNYESPLNNGAILYERDGAAPTHINYYYLVLDSDGNESSKVYFSKYHSVNESGTTESTDYDVFMFEDKEVSEDEWNSLTNEYLSNSSDLIIWNELKIQLTK
ncbi:hypothetical protein SAMN05446037_10359 [Anaerovirgula multivorans]|uniref:Uncharacterized protein n=1 Tax=Anaerovirgula multivorans TaxID=312168 RepID=A0A239JED7_9FIRM|nr:hypothetical protein [Anaerovirgula multivorans]SNT04169.1 hypothetical protein SAMN05446037_10359 [Anaerovirgula multivorans]